MKWYLDFGHGGKDSGAVGTYNTKESDVVLKIGMIIKENLEKHNQLVVLVNFFNNKTPTNIAT